MATESSKVNNIGDAVICRANVYTNDISVKYFRAFDFIAVVVRHFKRASPI